MVGMRSPGRIVVDPAGDPLAVRVWCGHAQIGTYDLRLYRSTRGELVPGWRFHGELRTPEQDTFSLPGSAKDNLRRVVRCRFRIGILEPNDFFSTFLTVLQGTRIAGELAQRGQARDPTVPVIMLAKFVESDTVAATLTLASDDDEGAI